jgi:iron complex transport system ATP-binding protein
VTLSKPELDSKVSLLSQQARSATKDTVFDFVAKSALLVEGIGRVSPRVRSEVEELLGRVGLLEFQNRRLNEVSEGLRQLAQIAAALVRKPELLLLDEPTSSLDYSRQLEIINLLSSLKRERNMTIVVVVHDLNLAARFADRIVMLHEGKIVAQGSPAEVITPANLASAFRILARVLEDPVGKTPLVIPIRQLP